jgi:hypothetical protein
LHLVFVEAAAGLLNGAIDRAGQALHLARNTAPPRRLTLGNGAGKAVDVGVVVVGHEDALAGLKNNIWVAVANAAFERPAPIVVTDKAIGNPAATRHRQLSIALGCDLQELFHVVVLPRINRQAFNSM